MDRNFLLFSFFMVAASVVDVLTTVYAVDILRIGVELNRLAPINISVGWGILARFAVIVVVMLSSLVLWEDENRSSRLMGRICLYGVSIFWLCLAAYQITTLRLAGAL